VVVVDGHTGWVRIERGHLAIGDGVAENQRERRFSKVAPPERLVVVGEGTISVEALRWLHRLGVSVVVLGGDDVLLASSPPGRNDARLRRAQALAAQSPAGLAIVRHLVEAKLRGQASVLRNIFGAEDTASTLDDLAGGVSIAEDAEEARQLEAVGAAAYFAHWSGHERTAVGFISKDRARVPPHWRVFDSRRSAITGAANTNKLAERPLNALLSLCYKLCEVEARFALVRLGLDPGLGVLHADAVGRDSLALDLLEPVRPAVDRFVLELVAERAFRKRDWVERSDGHVRCASELAHELASTMPTWRRAVAPHAEKLAHLLTDEIAGKTTITTPLTGAKTKAASAQVRRRKAAEARARAEAEHAAHRSSQPRRRPRTTDPENASRLFAVCIDCRNRSHDPGTCAARAAGRASPHSHERPVGAVVARSQWRGASWSDGDSSTLRPSAIPRISRRSVRPWPASRSGRS
jgi:CRISPR-associated endonuclease Cas1